MMTYVENIIYSPIKLDLCTSYVLQATFVLPPWPIHIFLFWLTRYVGYRKEFNDVLWAVIPG